MRTLPRRRLPTTPSQLTEGVRDTYGRARTPPDIALTPPSPRYCQLLAHGWDTFTETHNFWVGAADAYLDEAKEAARADDDEGRALATITLGGETYQVASHGAKGGVRWILRNPDMTVAIRGSKHWPVTVRYSAAGLWRHGLAALRDRTYHMVRSVFQCIDDTEPMLGQCHYAFDFYCPAFTEEMRFSSIVDQVVCLSAVKRRSDGVVPVATHGNAARLETLTIGTKAGLQVQVYDKTTELKEVPGKEWMRAVYASNGFEFSEDQWADVWRLEPRFGGAWLKERNIRHAAELLRFLPEVITEAIFSRRLAARPRGDYGHPAAFPFL